MQLTNDLLTTMEDLALVHFEGDERELAVADLEEVLSCLEGIQSVDTGDRQPLIHILQRENVFRDDVVHEFPRQDEILKNAPDEYEHYFVAPPTFD